MAEVTFSIRPLLKEILEYIWEEPPVWTKLPEHVPIEDMVDRQHFWADYRPQSQFVPRPDMRSIRKPTMRQHRSLWSGFLKSVPSQ